MKIKRVLLRLALATLIALPSLEVGARIADRGVDEPYKQLLSSGLLMYETHPYMGFALTPNYERDQEWSFLLNEYGMRSGDLSTRKPPGVFRIACLGGSTTFGTSIHQGEDTYPSMLERLLNERAEVVGGPRFQVLNFGVPGYTTVESLINLELRVLQFDLDMLVVYHAANDSSAIQRAGILPDYTPYRKVWSPAPVQGLDAFLLRHVRIFGWLTQGRPGSVQSMTMLHRITNELPQRHGDSGGFNARGVGYFMRNIHSIVSIARGNRVVPVLSTFGYCTELMRPQEANLIPAINSINARLRSYGTSEGVALVDVAEVMNDRRDLYADWMHRNEDGARLHATTLVDALVAQGLLPD